MDCRNAQILLAFAPAASGELDAADAAALKNHLDICPSCQAISIAERRFDEVVGRAVNSIDVPAGLKMRLMANLDTRRDAWYRRTGLRAAAAAAVILLAVFGSWLWLRTWRADVNLTAFRDRADYKHGAEAEEVQTWLDKVGGSHLKAPPQFNYTLLKTYAVVDLDGRQVPALLFVQKYDFAQVYILDGKVYDLASIQKQYDRHQTVLESGRQVRLQLLEHPSLADVRYLVLYTGSLKDFKKEQKGNIR